MKVEDKKAVVDYLTRLQLIRAAGRVNAFETEAEQSAEIEICKTDWLRGVNRWFPHYAASPSAAFQIEFANKVLSDQTIKAFAEWFRGGAKSVWCDIIIPFGLWINDQAHYMVLIGQNNDKASQLLGDLQAEFEANPQIIKDFGEQKLPGSWEAGDFKTVGCQKRGLKPFIGKALGMGQSVRGLRIGSQRPDLCVIDDVETKEFVKNPKRQDEYRKWVEADLIPTMDGPIRRLLYANNKFAVRMIQTELQKLHPNWYVSHVKAYDKKTWKPTWWQKYPDNYYKELLDEIGLIALEQEYLQEPKMEGKYFKSKMVVWDKMPNLNHFKIIVGHWDIAYTDNEESDYNAVRIWGLDKHNIYWYWQSFVKQSLMGEAVKYMCAVQKNLPDTVIVHWQFESQFWNGEVKRTITEVQKAEKVNLNLRQIEAKGKKYDRIISLYPSYQNNRIRYNDKMRADNDTIVGLQQLYDIEPGYTTHDDAPDADHQALKFLELHIPLSDTSADDEIKTGRMEPNHEAI
jgi:phage terminase large subunit-like protein